METRENPGIRVSSHRTGWRSNVGESHTGENKVLGRFADTSWLWQQWRAQSTEGRIVTRVCSFETAYVSSRVVKSNVHFRPDRRTSTEEHWRKNAHDRIGVTCRGNSLKVKWSMKYRQQFAICTHTVNVLLMYNIYMCIYITFFSIHIRTQIRNVR